MPTRPANLSQSDATRLFKAAAKANVVVRIEFRPDGTIIATTGRVAAPPAEDGSTDLDKWMEKQHANPA